MAATSYPSIRKAFLEIAYDNGGINRHRSEEQQAIEATDFLASRPYSDHFSAIDTWLASLSPDDLQTVCAGEQTEQEALLKNAPPFTDAILNEYFDEVC